MWRKRRSRIGGGGSGRGLAHPAPADGAHTLPLLASLQLKGSAALHLLIPQLDGSALFAPATQQQEWDSALEGVEEGQRRSGRSYSRSLFASGNDEAVPQRGVHGEDRPRVGPRHQPQQEVVSPHVDVAVDGAREGQVGLQGVRGE